MYVCDNCGKRCEREDELRNVFPDVPGLLERIEPGGTVPAGECPDCGMLVYLEKTGVKVLVLLDGGLVQEIVADIPGVEAAVLDMDLDGADEDEIVEVTGDGYELRGTLQAHEVSVAPDLMESAWRPVEQTT